MSDKFVIKFFEKLTPEDFESEDSLRVFYRQFLKNAKSSNIFQSYINYITRNTSDEVDIIAICDNIKAAMISASKTKDSTVKVLLNKKASIQVLCDFIYQSVITTYEEPEDTLTEKDLEFRDSTTCEIIDKIKADGREMPVPKPDIVLKQRNELLNIYHDTRMRCAELKATQPELIKVISKVYFFNLQNITNRPSGVTTETLISEYVTNTGVKKIEVILPPVDHPARYSNGMYATVTRLSSMHPIGEIIKCENKKSVYMCTGSQLVCGGNSDQGIDIAESMLYMTSTYPITLERLLHAYPLLNHQVVLCPNVVVFKDLEFKRQEIRQWHKICVMNVPALYKPKTNLSGVNMSSMMDERLHDATTMMDATAAEHTRTHLKNAIEMCLFNGYDTIVMDDRGIMDNWIPSHHNCQILKEVIASYQGRVKEFIICVPNQKLYKIFQPYFR